MPQDDDSAKLEKKVLYQKAGTAKGLSDKGTQDPKRKEIVIPEAFGRYRIVRELGRGNMGAVFLGHDEQLDRTVAIKIPFFSDDDEEVTERFYREARSMASVHHPNLCPIYDVGQFERWHFLTMAYIDGEPLSKTILRNSGLPWRDAVGLIRTISLALHKAHEAGLVHRDLKPSNIMLSRDGQPTVMDFGLARRIRPNETALTQPGEVFGSPAYMAPEQVEARHDEVGPCTDVYALGVILYEILTGTTPFRGSVASVFGQIVSRIPELPSKYRPDLPSLLDRICMQAMDKSPSNRFASARAFAEALGSITEDSGTHPSVGYFDPWETRLNRDAQETSFLTTGRNRRNAELRQVTLGVFRCEEGDEQVVEDASTEVTYTQSEMMHGRFQSFAALAMEQIERFGGHLLLNNGVELIACWGYPQTHEDSPQRAVRASLQIAKMLKDSKDKFELLPKSEMYCAALHSGEAVVESVDSSSGQSISLVGEVRTTALRLSALAEPGMVLI
ncbi:MAG: protein kinase domain-containing protein, partial [Planctomycetota bacterium]